MALLRSLSNWVKKGLIAGFNDSDIDKFSELIKDRISSNLKSIVGHFDALQPNASLQVVKLVVKLLVDVSCLDFNLVFGDLRIPNPPPLGSEQTGGDPTPIEYVIPSMSQLRLVSAEVNLVKSTYYSLRNESVRRIYNLCFNKFRNYDSAKSLGDPGLGADYIILQLSLRIDEGGIKSVIPVFAVNGRMLPSDELTSNNLKSYHLIMINIATKRLNSKKSTRFLTVKKTSASLKLCSMVYGDKFASTNGDGRRSLCGATNLAFAANVKTNLINGKFLRVDLPYEAGVVSGSICLSKFSKIGVSVPLSLKSTLGVPLDAPYGNGQVKSMMSVSLQSVSITATTIIRDSGVNGALPRFESSDNFGDDILPSNWYGFSLGINSDDVLTVLDRLTPSEKLYVELCAINTTTDTYCRALYSGIDFPMLQLPGFGVLSSLCSNAIRALIRSVLKVLGLSIDYLDLIIAYTSNPSFIPDSGPIKYLRPDAGWDKSTMDSLWLYFSMRTLLMGFVSSGATIPVAPISRSISKQIMSDIPYFSMMISLPSNSYNFIPFIQMNYGYVAKDAPSADF